MSARNVNVPVKAVEDFMAEVVTNFEAVESKLVVLKTRLAKRTIGTESIMRELDEMLTIIRR